ncbi:MAG: hypothetical protein U0984_02750, partial [Prosthecobacter sp.]|nr:hypothetical protein [Prosthecobacter sp.]
FGCDDTAKSEFLNKRKAKGDIVGPGRSQSNLWFVQPETLDRLGPALGRGAVWLQDVVKSGETSEPFLFTGFAHRSVHLVNEDAEVKTFILEVDAAGNGQWQKLKEVEVAAKGCAWLPFTAEEKGTWVRLKTTTNAACVTALFYFQNDDTRSAEPDGIFAGIATPEDTQVTGGLMHARGADFKTLRYLARDGAGDLGCYDLDGTLALRQTNDIAGQEWTREHVAIPKDILIADAASILYVDDKGGRWRLPRGSAALDAPGVLGEERIDREVCTERDLFNAGGIFYELPADNAGGFAKIRPITTHNRRIKDYASYRGMLVMSGVRKDAAGEHIIKSDDGKTSLWLGAVDDLWQFGKARGFGGPWKDSGVKAGIPSDPYLMTGFDDKTLTLSHNAAKPVTIRVEVDIAGTGLWCPYREFQVAAGEPLVHHFPKAFGAYWLRLVADQDCVATGQLVYE